MGGEHKPAAPPLTHRSLEILQRRTGTFLMIFSVVAIGFGIFVASMKQHEALCQRRAFELTVPLCLPADKLTELAASGGGDSAAVEGFLDDVLLTALHARGFNARLTHPKTTVPPRRLVRVDAVGSDGKAVLAGLGVVAVVESGGVGAAAGARRGGGGGSRNTTFRVATVLHELCGGAPVSPPQAAVATGPAVATVGAAQPLVDLRFSDEAYNHDTEHITPHPRIRAFALTSDGSDDSSSGGSDGGSNSSASKLRVKKTSGGGNKKRLDIADFAFAVENDAAAEGRTQWLPDGSRCVRELIQESALHTPAADFSARVGTYAQLLALAPGLATPQFRSSDDAAARAARLAEMGDALLVQPLSSGAVFTPRFVTTMVLEVERWELQEAANGGGAHVHGGAYYRVALRTQNILEDALVRQVAAALREGLGEHAVLADDACRSLHQQFLY